jgi:DNA-binding MarR family transcriptional regulator
MENDATREQAADAEGSEVKGTETAGAETAGAETAGAETAGAETAGAELGGQVRSAVGRLYRRFRSERPEGGLGDTALAVLSRLHKHGAQTLTDLSEHDRVSPASMSQTVNRLTSAGYAVRTRDPDDRRKVLFSTTAEGDELASAARAQRNAWLDQRLQALSAEDRAVIGRATALLASIADS